MLYTNRAERLKVERVALGIGLESEYNGSDFIIDAAILLAFTGMPMPDIYATVAAFREKTANGIHKDAAYAIRHSDGLADKLSEMFGIELMLSDLHPNTVIAYIAKATDVRMVDAIYDKVYG